MGYKRSRLKISSGTENTTAARGKKTVSGRRLNRRKYAELLSSTLPRIIESDAELQQVTESVEPLLDKGARRTPEEEALCRLLIRLIEDYQQSHPVIPKLGPRGALEALLEARNLRQVDLLPIFGSRSRVSDAVNGKREISKSQARKLGEFFSVSPDLFI
jgi:HTH-type transcriptional regulator / antitoxin HigA